MRSLQITAMVFMVCGTPTFAQVVARIAQHGTQSMIHGVAIDVEAHPLPSASVRLRNLTTNQVEQKVTANLAGEFNFVAQPEIPYVVEIIDQAGHIIAVGDVIVAHA